MTNVETSQNTYNQPQRFMLKWHFRWWSRASLSNYLGTISTRLASKRAIGLGISRNPFRTKKWRFTNSFWSVFFFINSFLRRTNRCGNNSINKTKNWRKSENSLKKKKLNTKKKWEGTTRKAWKDLTPPAGPSSKFSDNRAFPSSPQSLFQSESKREIFVMIISSNFDIKVNWFS